jgi:GxxExxY protein
VLTGNPRVNEVTRATLAAAIEVHRILGPGLLESIYSACLQYELTAAGIRFAVQQPIPVVYKAARLQGMYRVDLIVEDLVVVEVKCVETLTHVHRAQMLTYLKLSKCQAGLLINFNEARLMDGVKRVLNDR